MTPPRDHLWVHSTSAAALDAPQSGDGSAVRARVVGALDGVCFSFPVSLGCVTIIFSRIGGDAMASGMFATMLALVVAHLLTARAGRPILYSARVFEAVALAAMIDQVVAALPLWNVPDSVEVRLAFLCLIGTGASLCVGALYLMRAHRLTQMIPAPVLAGFANGIALALVISQSSSLWGLLMAPGALAAGITIAVATFAAAYTVRRWRPRWPAAATGLAVGSALGLMWLAAGVPARTVSTNGLSLTPPLFLADFPALLAPGVHTWSIIIAVAVNGAILGLMVFINTAMAGQAVTQFDGRRADPRDAVLRTLALVLAGAIGAAPLSGTPNASLAAARSAVITPSLLVLVSAIVAALYLSGSFGWIPLVAVCSVLLCEAWFTADRESLRLLRDWIARQPLATNAREDLGLISAVTAAAVFVNMVAAVFVGLMLGLLMFGLRNARQPVRYIWSGGQLSSNCARSRADLRCLAEHASGIRIFELEGDLSFAAVERIEQSLASIGNSASCIVFDWSRVRHIDSSVSKVVAKFEHASFMNHVLVIHAGADMQTGNVGPELLRRLPGTRFAPDLDYALEVAENQLIQLFGKHNPGDETSMLEAAASLFEGLEQSARDQLGDAMPQKFFPAGAVMLVAGDPSDELMLVLHGSASVIVRSLEGKDVRVAGIRHGAMIGEVGFLDGAPRSATVVAHEDTTVAILTRESYQALGASAPRAVERLLANIALGLAARLRRANQLSALRNSHR